MLTDLLRDEEYREELAKSAYHRERCEDAARDREHETGDYEYFCMAWEDLSSESKRPYRTAVATTCDALYEVASAIA